MIKLIREPREGVLLTWTDVFCDAMCDIHEALRKEAFKRSAWPIMFWHRNQLDAWEEVAYISSNEPLPEYTDAEVLYISKHAAMRDIQEATEAYGGGWFGDATFVGEA